MINCPSCSREIPQDSRVCPYCAEAIEVEPAAPTVTTPPKAAGRAGPSGSSSDSIDQARFTPGTMLAERYRIVGRGILIGLAVTSVGLLVLGTLNLFVRNAFGLQWVPGNAPGNPGFLDPLLGLRQVVAALCHGVAFSILLAFVYLVLPLLFRLALRSFWLGAAAFVLAWSTNLYLGFGDGTAWSVVFIGLCVTFFVTVVHRVGLLAGATSFYCWYSLDLLPLTADMSKWYAGSSLFCLATLGVLAIAAFWICLAGRPILKDELFRP